MSRFKRTKFEYKKFIAMVFIVLLTIISSITLYDMYLKIDTNPDTYVNVIKTYETAESVEKKFNIVDELENLTRKCCRNI